MWLWAALSALNPESSDAKFLSDSHASVQCISSLKANSCNKKRAIEAEWLTMLQRELEEGQRRLVGWRIDAAAVPPTVLHCQINRRHGLIEDWRREREDLRAQGRPSKRAGEGTMSHSIRRGVDFLVRCEDDPSEQAAVHRSQICQLRSQLEALSWRTKPWRYFISFMKVIPSRWSSVFSRISVKA